VTLRSTRAWKSGSSEISFDHDGQTFYFTAPEKRDEFKADPARYAPKLLGCDPVVLADSDLAVRGSVKFGAFYEGELFLFETAQTRAKFRKDPTHYARLQHALKLEDIQRIASASGN
jgi:YHS domain-containing protein